MEKKVENEKPTFRKRMNQHEILMKYKEAYEDAYSGRDYMHGMINNICDRFDLRIPDLVEEFVKHTRKMVTRDVERCWLKKSFLDLSEDIDPLSIRGNLLMDRSLGPLPTKSVSCEALSELPQQWIKMPHVTKNEDDSGSEFEETFCSSSEADEQETIQNDQMAKGDGSNLLKCSSFNYVGGLNEIGGQENPFNYSCHNGENSGSVYMREKIWMVDKYIGTDLDFGRRICPLGEYDDYIMKTMAEEEKIMVDDKNVGTDDFEVLNLEMPENEVLTLEIPDENKEVTVEVPIKVSRWARFKKWSIRVMTCSSCIK